jgi:4-hydroxybenzoate polyprenyltransferase
MKHYLSLIRPLNLIVLALSMLLFRYCIVDAKTYALYGFKPYLSDAAFYVLLIVTLLVTAGGYVINDIMDVDTDRINREERLIIDQHISEQQAFSFYKVLVGLAVAGSVALMFMTGQFKISGIPLIIIVVLYLYAQIFKRMGLAGNLVVAVCAALPVMLIALYEFKINEFDTAVVVLITKGIGLSAFAYGLFAFLTTLSREIIKDMEDAEGDLAIDARTLPISAGYTVSKIVVFLIQTLTLGLLALVALFLLALRAQWPFYGLVAFLIVPLLVQMLMVLFAKKPAQFRIASSVGKVHILFGVLSMLYFHSGSAPQFFTELLKHVQIWLS